MKYLILFIVISTYCFANDKIERFENTYIKKAEQLKATRDKSVKEADVKFEADSRKLAEAYIKVLKREQIAIVKTGDLEGALKIKAKIIEIENVLKGQASRPKVVKSIFLLKEPIIGSWNWPNNQIVTFISDGTYNASKGSNGTWIKIATNRYQITNSDDKSKQILQIINENTLHNSTHDFKVARQGIIDPVVGIYTNCIDNGKSNNWNVRINSNATFDIIFPKDLSKNYSGKWKKKNGVYTFIYPHPSSYSTLILKNGSLRGKHYYKGKINQLNRIWSRPIRNTPIGTWEHLKSKVIYTFDGLGNLSQSKGYKGVWKMIGVANFTIKWNHQKTTEIHYIISNGQQLKVENIIWAKRIIVDPIHGLWKSINSGQKFTFDIKTDHTAIHSGGTKGKWSTHNNQLTIHWSNGQTNSFIIKTDLLVGINNKFTFKK